MANPQQENGHTRIAHELLLAYAQIRIPPEAMRCLMVIWHKIYGFGKKKDRISSSQFYNLTDMTRRSVFRGLKWLLEHNLINSVKNDTRETPEYSIVKDYELWKNCGKTPSVKNDIMSKSVTDSVTPPHVGGVKNDTNINNKHLSKTTRVRASNFNINLKKEIQNLKKLNFDKEQIKQHLLMRQIQECDIDRAMGKHF